MSRKKRTIYKTVVSFTVLSDEPIENDTLQNIHFTIGSNIAKLLDDKLK